MSFLLSGRRADAIPDSVAPQELVNQWPVQELNGDPIEDIVGEDDGQLSGASIVENGNAIAGHELTFDGSDDFVDTGASNPAGSMSMAVTVEYSDNDGGAQTLHGTQQGSNAGTRTLDFRPDITHNRLQFFAANDSDDADPVEHIVDGPGRYRLGGYIDADNNEIGVVVNGDIKNTVSFSGNFQTQLSNHKMGRRPDESSRFFDGELDEPKWWDKALSGSEWSDEADRHDGLTSTS